MAVDCDRGWLHVNSDWVVLEPVDEYLHATPPGQASHSVLLTNLANHVQPVIRYDLGDSVLAGPDPCPCGSPFPAIRVQGRSSDVLRLTAPDGRTVTLPALAVGSVLERPPAVLRSQVLRTGERSLRLRLDLLPGEPPEPAWAEATARLTAYLAAQGLGDVTVVRAQEAPQRSVPGGKLRQVLAG
jgi:phenylacetate-coenzyme A ligase PaaK-like adenylate-forming protein